MFKFSKHSSTFKITFTCFINKLVFFTGGPESEDQTRLRFQVELEFVQCLANPNYLNCKF